MKLRLIASIVCITFVALISPAQAVECCEGKPLESGYSCCNDKQIFAAIYTCCTTAQETGWQTTYNTCITAAKKTRDDTEKTEQDTYNKAKGALDWACDKAGLLCGAAGTPKYEACFDDAQTALGPSYLTCLTAYNAAIAGTELDYAHDKGSCADDNPSAKITCEDGFQLKTS